MNDFETRSRRAALCERVRRGTSTGPARLTFDEFRATALPVDDLHGALGVDSPYDYETDPRDRTAGRIYIGTLYIVDNGPPASDPCPYGRYSVPIGNDEPASDSLEEIERILYDWAASERFFVRA